MKLNSKKQNQRKFSPIVLVHHHNHSSKLVIDVYQVIFNSLHHSIITQFLFIGLTFAEETNLKSLEKYYDFLREKYARIEETAITKYTNREKRIELQTLFEQKLAELDSEREQRLTLRNRLRLYHLVWRTIKKYIEDEKNSANPAADSRLLEDVIMKAIYESANLFPKSTILVCFSKDNDSDCFLS